jgi:hypothetical protein
LNDDLPFPMSIDKELSRLIRSWDPSLEPSVGFNRSVWSKIEASESRSKEGLFSWVQGFATPRLAATCVALALFGGILIGGVQARSSQEDRYLRSLQPFAAGTQVR